LRWKGRKMLPKTLQCLFKSSHSGNTFYNFKYLIFYVFFSTRTLVILLNCRRQPRCKRLNVNCFDCSKNFLFNSL
jgi:hypothetical protein